MNFIPLAVCGILIFTIGCGNNRAHRESQAGVSPKPLVQEQIKFPFWNNLRWGMAPREVLAGLGDSFRVIRQSNRSVLGYVMINDVQFECEFHFVKNQLQAFGCFAETAMVNAKVDEYRKWVAKTLGVPFKTKGANGVMVDSEPFSDWTYDFYQPNPETQISLNIRERPEAGWMIRIKFEGIWYGHFMGQD